MKNKNLSVATLSLFIAASFVFCLNQLSPSRRAVDVLTQKVPPSSLLAQAPSSGLIAYYTLDAVSGTTAADTAGSNTGTLTNGPTWTTGRIGGAVSLDGVDDYIALNNSVIGAGDLSVCSWFYAKAPAAFRYEYLVNNAQFGIALDTFSNPTYYINVENNGGTRAISAGFTANAWHHQCTTRTGSNISMYIDGALSGNAGQPAGTPTVSVFKSFLGQYAAGGNYFLGNIDDVRIYNRALTSTEVGQMYVADVGNPANDALPPIFSTVSSSVSPTTATITWTTDEPSDSAVEYGPTTSYGTITAVNSAMVTSHSIIVSGLSPQTIYHFRVRSKDAPGNQGIDSIDKTFTTAAPAGTANEAATCNYNDVKNAIAVAADDGVVLVPAGSCAWSQQMYIDLTNPSRSLTIKSKNGCTLDAKGRPTSCTTILLDANTASDWAGDMFHVEIPSGKTFRFSGFTIRSDSSISGIGNKGNNTFTINGNSGIFRLDHNIFDDSKHARTLIPTGAEPGVLDHNLFTSNVGFVADIWDQGLGNQSWAKPIGLGGSGAIFIEDNTLNNLLVTDAHRGGRLVVRHNDINTSATPIQNHGTESGSGVRGGVVMEAYNNNIQVNGPQYAGFVRSGTALFFNNTITGSANVVTALLNYRNAETEPAFGTCDGTGPYDINDGVTYASGTYTGLGITENQSLPASVIDATKNWTTNQWVGYSIHNDTRGWGSEIVSNTTNSAVPVVSAVSGYGFAGVIEHAWLPGDTYRILRADICLDQPGYGQTDLLSDYGGNPSQRPQPMSPPHQKSEPVYTWNNTINGTSNNKISNNFGAIKKNRDYFEGVCRPGYAPYTYPHPLVQQQDNVASIAQPLNCPGTPASSSLSITKAGVGSGTVVGGAISCGSTCSTSVTNGTSVALTATPGSGSTFSGWSGGGCSGTGTCNVTVNSNTTITATFGGGTDTTPPVISSIASTNITTTGASINWALNETGTSLVAYGLTTAYGSKTATSSQGGANLSGLTPNTVYHYRIEAADTAGNYTVGGDNTFTTLVLDTTAPTVFISLPTNNATVSGAVVPISALATDNIAVQSVRFKMDGTDIDPLFTTFPYTGTWDTLGVSNGTHTLTAIATDTSGNTKTSSGISVTVNNTAPNNAPVLTTIGNKTIGEGSLLSFTTLATDADLDTLTYSATNLPVGATFNTSTHIFSFTPTYTQSGSYNVTFSVSDGKATDQETITITVTNTNRPPVADAGSNQSITLPTQALLDASASSDPDGPISSYQWSNTTPLIGTVTFGNANSAKTTATFSTNGIYILQVQVSDGSLTSKSQVTIAVGAALPNNDDDQDGVINTLDKCPNTPPQLRSQVNQIGCPKPLTTGFTIVPDPNSTDLTAISTLDISNTYGKVVYPPISGTYSLVKDAGTYKDQINLDSNLAIERGSITLVSSNVPELNKPAIVTLTGLTFTTPRILKDGVLCTTCSITSYTGGALIFTVTGFSTYTVEETPVAAAPSGGGGGGGGSVPPPAGGGGGSSSAPPAGGSTSSSGIITPTVTQIPLPPAGGSGGGSSTCTTVQSSSSFTRNLTTGATGSDVKALQVYLNNHGFQISLSGAGSPGNETTYFGPATTRALAKYQLSKGITPAAGYFGPLTRASIPSTGSTPTTVCTTPTTTITPTTFTGSFTRNLTIGATGADVKALQVYLNTHGFSIAQTGPGSKGLESTYFGPATKAALIRYQTSKNITPASGLFGPLTRASIR